MALSMFKRCYKNGNEEETAKCRNVLNVDQLMDITQEIKIYDNKVFISKCQAHVGIVGNEIADSLAKMGRDMK
jgi:ribonuclease HI